MPADPQQLTRQETLHDRIAEARGHSEHFALSVRIGDKQRTFTAEELIALVEQEPISSMTVAAEETKSAPGLALDSGEFIPAEQLNTVRA